MKFQHPNDEKLRRLALADRLDGLSRRGLVMQDELSDITGALEILSEYYDCGADLFELECVLVEMTDSIYLTTTQRKELEVASALCRNERLSTNYSNE